MALLPAEHDKMQSAPGPSGPGALVSVKSRLSESGRPSRGRRQSRLLPLVARHRALLGVGLLGLGMTARMAPASEGHAAGEGCERQSQNGTLHDTHRYAPSFGCVPKRLCGGFRTVK